MAIYIFDMVIGLLACDVNLALSQTDMPRFHSVFDHAELWVVLLVLAVESVLFLELLRRRRRRRIALKQFSRENRQIQHQLEESQNFLRSVIDSLQLRIFWKDTQCRYQGCNIAFAADAGLASPDDVIGKADSEMPWGAAFGEQFVRSDREVLETGRAKLNYEEAVCVGSGRGMVVRTSKMPLMDLSSRLIGVLGTYEDISDYKRLQEIVEKRIVSLTRCMDDPDTLEFGKLFNLEEIQRIQDEFSESTGVSSVIVAPDGGTITRTSRMSSVCERMLKLQHERCGSCFEFTGGLVGAASKGPVFRRCERSGLSMAVCPIVVGGVHVAGWIAGHVRIDDENVREVVDCAVEAGMDPELYREECRRVPEMSMEKFVSIAETMNALCVQLSIFATQNISQARMLHEEKERQGELRKYHAAIDQIPSGVMIIGKDRRIQFVNPAFSKITGYSREEAIGMDPMVFSGGGDEEKIRDLVATVSSGRIWTGRLTNRRKDGTVYVEESVVSPVFDDSGAIINCVATMRDITADVAREEELRHRQKMAAVGQLAGGVAHDFNNVLQAILGFSEILVQKLEPGTLEFMNAEQICFAAKRAASLTRGLLAISRKEQDNGVLDDVDINFLLRDSQVLLNLIGSAKIEIVYDLAQDLQVVRFSNDKFYQVVMNLLINARDAMPEGGRVTIRTYNVRSADLNPDHLPPGSGDYVCMSVIDQGHGIPEGVRKNIFDPFYTTKEVGKGSGLGLSIVYVLVKNYGGEVCFESEVGDGTKFFVYLPVRKE